MKKTDIVIYGFDYESTEHIIDIYTEGLIDYSSIYVNMGVHREDKLLCHLRIGEHITCPYIFIGRADVLYARTLQDAVRCLQWIREKGTLRIDERDNGQDGNQHIRELLRMLEGSGAIVVQR